MQGAPEQQGWGQAMIWVSLGGVQERERGEGLAQAQSSGSQDGGVSGAQCDSYCGPLLGLPLLFSLPPPPPSSSWDSEEKRNRAITARRQHLKSVMLQIAATELEKEESRRESEKQNYLSEHCPPLHIPGSMSEVQELCKQLHSKIDVAEEEKYDMEVKVQKSSKELEDMNQKLFDLRGKFKRPPLRRVRMSADAMLKALLGSKHKVCMDLRANLKQVKKEDTEKERDLRDVGDWRKNIEEKSGMEGRKKMFESES
ncbi:troponin I, fast skeletal muscle [Psammomys obesus]|uniref:troponin I, fast skeletal muscle n=1 Tax=Psammomys obesus TaxID=48139 RepID=UPI00245286D0|nr:troponin I, fast skeletal muscle [Psammomys obesus]